MYHYADPLASLTINVNKPGDRFLGIMIQMNLLSQC